MARLDTSAVIKGQKIFTNSVKFFSHGRNELRAVMPSHFNGRFHFHDKTHVGISIILGKRQCSLEIQYGHLIDLFKFSIGKGTPERGIARYRRLRRWRGRIFHEFAKGHYYKTFMIIIKCWRSLRTVLVEASDQS